jgi:HSP20 family molecular chaperone IbpA
MSAVIVPEATVAGYVAPVMQIVGAARSARASRPAGARRFAAGRVIQLPPRPAWSPAVNVFDTGDSYVVIAELAGVGPDSLRIELDASGDLLTLRGTRADTTLAEALKYERPNATLAGAAPVAEAVAVDQEIATGSFERAIEFDEPVESGRARAVCRYGLLQLMVPKRRGRRPLRRAPVGAAGSTGRPRLRAVAC